MAKQCLASEKYEQAEKLLKKALVYPENLGDGKLEGTKDNHLFYHLGLALEAQGKLDNDTKFVTVTAEKGVRTCVPQCLNLPKAGEQVRLFMRVANPERKVKLVVKSGENVVLQSMLPVANPSEMIAVDIPAAKAELIGDSLTVFLDKE